MKEIDLNTYRSIDTVRNITSKVFTGRDRGLDVRRRSHIDDFIKSGDVIHIKVPEDIYSINPSFLEEFLYTAVKEYGKEGYKKYVFFEEPFRFKRQLNEAVERIIRSSTALDS